MLPGVPCVLIVRWSVAAALCVWLCVLSVVLLSVNRCVLFVGLCRLFGVLCVVCRLIGDVCCVLFAFFFL